MKSRGILGATILIILFFSGQLYASRESLVKVESRSGIEQKFIFIKPDKPLAAVVLFEGSHGGLNISSWSGKPRLKWGANGFLARTRQSFANHGLMVALIDSPKDKKKMDAVWRMSKEHADDVMAVIGALKKEANVPIWVIGMSMGTFSASNAAIRLGSGVDGLVLVSSMTVSRKSWDIYESHPNGIINMPLDKVLVSTLIVFHKDDKCPGSPAANIPKLKLKLINSSKIDSNVFSGGKYPKSKPCQSLSQHGFYGIEEQVVKAITDFITAN